MRHRSRRRGRAWKLTDPWTQRTRPPILAKPQNGFAQAPTRLINISLFRRTQDQNLSESVVSYPQILRRRRKHYGVTRDLYPSLGKDGTPAYSRNRQLALILTRGRGQPIRRPNGAEGWTSTLKIPFDGRMSTSDMAKESSDRIALLQGTLDMLILRTLLFGPAHGHEIAKHIQRTTEDVLQVEHGSLYPALHRLERKGCVASKWEIAKDRNREFKYYRLTPVGRKQLTAEESKWKQLAGAIARVMWPAEG